MTKNQKVDSKRRALGFISIEVKYGLNQTLEALVVVIGPAAAVTGVVSSRMLSPGRWGVVLGAMDSLSRVVLEWFHSSRRDAGSRPLFIEDVKVVVRDNACVGREASVAGAGEGDTTFSLASSSWIVTLEDELESVFLTVGFLIFTIKAAAIR